MNSVRPCQGSGSARAMATASAEASIRSEKTAATRSSFAGKRRKRVARPTPASRATEAMEAFRPSRRNTARAAVRIRARLRSASLRKDVSAGMRVSLTNWNTLSVFGVRWAEPELDKPFRLGERTAVPTIAIVGAGPGMGLAIARTFGSRGFDVALVARNQAKLDSLVDQLAAQGITAAAFPADVLDHEALTQALKNAATRFGGIDVLEYSPAGTIATTTLTTPSQTTPDDVR